MLGSIVWVVFTLWSTLLVPPLQKPDEVRHYFRAAAIVDGSWLCSSARTEELVVPDWAISFAGAMDQVKDRFDWHLYLHRYQSTPVATKAAIPCKLPAVGYLPSALGLLLGLMVNNQMLGFILARWLGAVGMMVVVVGSWRWWPRSWRPYLVIWLFLPMVVHQLTAISYDQVWLPLMVWQVALVGRWVTRGEQVSWSAWLSWSVLLFGMATIRSGYQWLILLGWSVPARLLGRTWWDRAAKYLVSLMIIAGPALVVWLQPTQFVFPTARGGCYLVPADVCPQVQQALIRHDPGYLVAAGWRSWSDQGWYRLRESLLVMGDNRVGVGDISYGLMLLALSWSWAAAARCDSEKLATWQSSLWLASLGLCVVTIMVGFSLLWTRVGAPHIDGLLGRYFVPLILIGMIGVAQLINRTGTKVWLGLVVTLAVAVVVTEASFAAWRQYYSARGLYLNPTQLSDTVDHIVASEIHFTSLTSLISFRFSLPEGTTTVAGFQLYAWVPERVGAAYRYQLLDSGCQRVRSQGYLHLTKLNELQEPGLYDQVIDPVKMIGDSCLQIERLFAVDEVAVLIGDYQQQLLVQPWFGVK